MTRTLPWNDGSGESITLTMVAMSGNQIVEFSSPDNISVNTRTRDIVFETFDSMKQVKVTISQMPTNLGIGNMMIGNTFIVR